MLAFQIGINGERRVVAGCTDCDTLNVSLVVVTREGGSPPEFYFNVGGLIHATVPGQLEHVRWRLPTLKLGDTVSVAIVDVDDADPRGPGVAGATPSTGKTGDAVVVTRDRGAKLQLSAGSRSTGSGSHVCSSVSNAASTNVATDSRQST